MKDFMAIARALADENRTRVVMFLRKGEMCFCQIVEMLGLAPSTVSKHLDILASAGLIESRKAGRWVYYRLPQVPAPRAKEALCWLNETLGKDPKVTSDAKRAKGVMKMDKEGLCCRYKRT